MVRDPLRLIPGRIAGYLDAAAEQWFGHTIPPPARVVRECGWMPDPREAYCRRCGDSIGPGEATANGCGACRARPPIADGFVRLGPHSKELRNWIIQIKYQQRWFEMGRLLGRRLADAIIDAEAVDRERTLVVPMPMPWQRRIYRGIDHARVIATAVAGGLGSPVELVLKQTNGRPQVDLPPSRRARSVARRMHARRRFGGWDLKGLDVVLVDDVKTTGASLRAAVRLLKKLGPDRIIAAVLAVSDDVARRERAEQGGAGGGVRTRADAAITSNTMD